MFKPSIYDVIQGKTREDQNDFFALLNLSDFLHGKTRQDQETYLKSTTLFMAMRNVSHAERVSAMKTIGMTQDQAEDYVASCFPRYSPLHQIRKDLMNKKSESDARMEATLERVRAKMEEAKNNPVAKVQEEHTQFDRDRAHNRFLLGGETDFEVASFSNPAFDKTRPAASWIRNEFIQSGLRIALMLGGTGIGKTWAGLAYVARTANIEWGIGLKIIRSNAHYVTAYRISEMLNQRGRFQDSLDSLRTVPILLIDELGGEGPEFKGDNSKFSAYLDSLTEERHKFRNRKTIITSNHTLDDFRIAYGERVLSRIMDVGLIHSSAEKDMRI